MCKGKEDNIYSLCKYLPFRAKMLENLRFQLDHKSSGMVHEGLCKGVIEEEAKYNGITPIT
jgi:hypothetical protein